MNNNSTSQPVLVFTSIGFGVAAFIVAFSLGSVLTMTTGIPLAGGLLNGVLTAMILTIGLVSTHFFGSATLMWVVFAALASLTTTLGPPGIYKIVIGAIAGIIWDLVYFSSKRKSWGLYIGAILGSASIMLTLVGALMMGFGEDAAEALARYQDAFYFILAINLVVTLIGVYLGDFVYRKRLSELPAFKNLQRHAK